MHRNFLLFVAIVVTAILAGLATSYVFALHSASNSRTELAEYVRGHIVLNRDVLDEYYRKYGGKSLVLDVEAEATKLTRASIHSTGHSVGEVLYRHEGLGAVATCGDAFGYGCLHQVIGKAFATMGSSTLPSLLARCNQYADAKDTAQCQHGLGHGIMYAEAYDETKLEEMMRECDAITTKRPIPKNDSCHAGLMMEFNMHYMTMEYEGENGRPVDPHVPFAICDRLQGNDHKSICVWWAVPWIHGNIFDYWHNVETFRELGGLCDTLQDAGLKRTCFDSIGRSNGINANTKPEDALLYCQAATDDAQLQIVCIERTVKGFRAAGNVRDGAELCRLAQEKLPASCISAMHPAEE